MSMMKSSVLAVLTSLLFVNTTWATDSTATLATTHIESSPWQMIKIESPGHRLPGWSSSFDLCWLFANDSFVQDKYQLECMYFIHVPFTSAIQMRPQELMQFNQITAKSNEQSMPGCGDNPIAALIHWDQPLFCLMNNVSLMTHVEGHNNSWRENEMAYRIRVFDSLPLTIYKGDFWNTTGGKWHDIQIFDIPMSTPFRSIKSQHGTELTVCGILFVDGWKDSRSQVESHQHLLDAGALALFAHDRTAESEKFEILRMPFSTPIWSKNQELDTKKTEWISLPFIGPAFSTWRHQNDATSHWGIFPHLWLWATSTSSHHEN